MGISTLIKTLTADNDSSLAFVDGTASVVLDGTYDEYMFVCTDIDTADDSIHPEFQGSIDSGSNYNIAMTTTYFIAGFYESGSSTIFGYNTGLDQAQGTADQQFSYNQGSGADESGSGIIHLFNPASTTYVKHFYSRFISNGADEIARDNYVAGYFNTTSAIDAIRFKIDSGNITAGTFQLYGIS